RSRFAHKLDALRARHWAGSLDFGDDVVGHGIDLIRLQRRRGTDRLQVAEILGGHVVAALIGIGEPVKMRHRRSRPPALYRLAYLIAGQLRLAQRGRIALGVEAGGEAVSGPTVALRAPGLIFPDPLSVGHILAMAAVAQAKGTAAAMVIAAAM